MLLVSGFVAPAVASGQSTSNVAFNLRSYAAGGEPRAIAAADFNDDGAPDFATANLTLAGGAASGVAVFYNKGNGTFSAATPIATGAGAFDLATADLNRDGRVDLAVSNADANTVTVLLSSEAGLIPTFTWVTSASPRGIVSGDFNRDGRIDLAVVGYNCGCVDVGRGNGDGTITTLATFEVAPQPESITTADLNRDGTLDLFIGTAGGRALVLFGSANGQFVQMRDSLLSKPGRAVDVADFDGDGRTDVIVVADNTWFIYYRNFTGLFSGGSPPDLRGVVAFDVNSDGWPDFAEASRSGGTVGVSVNRGVGGDGFGLSAPRRFAVGAGARAVAAADVDGDGRTDLISANQIRQDRDGHDQRDAAVHADDGGEVTRGSARRESRAEAGEPGHLRFAFGEGFGALGEASRPAAAQCEPEGPPTRRFATTPADSLREKRERRLVSRIGIEPRTSDTSRGRSSNRS